MVSNSGSSPVRIRSMHYDQFKNDDGTPKIVPIYCRFVEDTEESKVIGQVQVMRRVGSEEQVCNGPKTDY